MLGGKFKIIFIFTLLVIKLSAQLYEDNSYQDYVLEIERSFAEKMKKEYDLFWTGTSGTQRGRVEEMGMSFLAKRKATLEEARALLLMVNAKFVKAINAHEEIQFYLIKRPFTYKLTTISINFEGPNGRNSDGSITYAFNVSDNALTSSRNHIVYYAHDPFKDELIEQHEEPYTEAIKLYKASKINPSIHKENEYEAEIDALLASFTENIINQYPFERVSIGGKLTNGIEEIGAKFRVYQFVTLEDARQLIVDVVEKLLRDINSNEKIRPYLKQFPFPASLIKLNLAFKEPKYHPFPDISIMNVILDENKITYVQKIILPQEEGKVFRDTTENILAEESYPEALEIVEKNPVKFKAQFPSLFDRVRNWFSTTITTILYFFVSFFI